LIRDAAYETLLKSRRKELHRLIAQTVSENFPAIKESQPEVLARHWAEAGETEKAITEWTRTGKAAAARYAFPEGQESLQQALALLNQLPESRERDLRELELREPLVPMLHMTRGWGVPEAVEAGARIQLLTEKTGDLSRLILSVRTNCLQAFVSGDFSAAGALGDRGLELARRASNPPREMVGLLCVQQMVHFYRGDLSGAESHFASALKFFDDSLVRQATQNPIMAIFAHASFTAWLMGRADVARKRLAGMRAAVNPANPNDFPRSDQFAAQFLALMRENEIAEALAARAVELNEKHGFPKAPAQCLLGYPRAQLGRPAEGIALMRQGIGDKVKIGERILVPWYLTQLAEAEFCAGAIDDALETVEHALNFNPEDVVFHPETFRIRGEMRLKRKDLKAADTDFRNSIAMARSMGAKAWELRTTMSLARLLRDSGRCDEAHSMLAEIYNWFTEGFDTADLRDAKALLEELT
jgi:tetratricopeptide (TPR) repeat protein